MAIFTPAATPNPAARAASAGYLAETAAAEIAAPVRAVPLTRNLRPEEIRYLVFEGGGGKGAAYLGVLEALERIPAGANAGILRYTGTGSRQRLLTPREGGQIHGVAGASAGAITALLVSCGVSSSGVRDWMRAADFNSFFDSASLPGLITRQRLVPLITGLRRRPAAPANCAVRDDTLSEAALFRAISIPGIIPLAPRMLQDFPQRLAYLWRDMGLFSGCNARRVFAQLLASRMGAGGDFDATFQDHFNHFGIELAVTGSNLVTGTATIFSHRTTPSFPVADAIRISMGLPFIFKPVVIPSGQLAGVWVDGGLWDNLPFEAFAPQGTTTTLSFRLDMEPRFSIRHFGDFLLRWLDFALFGTGTAQTGRLTQTRRVLIDPRGLSLLVFKPAPEVLEPAVRDARQRTLRYFGG